MTPYWQVRRRTNGAMQWQWATAHGWTWDGAYAYKFGCEAMAREFAHSAGAEVLAHGTT